MKVKTTVRVTQEIIDASECCHIYKCAIAVAIRNAMGLETGVHVYPGYAIVPIERSTVNRISIPLPKIVSDFIEAIDAGQPAEPFEFEIELPVLD